MSPIRIAESKAENQNNEHDVLCYKLKFVAITHNFMIVLSCGYYLLNNELEISLTEKLTSYEQMIIQLSLTYFIYDTIYGIYTGH